jgi:hypothetical protein
MSVWNVETGAGQKTESYFNNYIRAKNKARKKTEEVDRQTYGKRNPSAKKVVHYLV